MATLREIYDKYKTKKRGTYKPPVAPEDMLGGMLGARAVRVGKPVAVNLYRKVGPALKKASQVVKKVTVNKYKR